MAQLSVGSSGTVFLSGAISGLDTQALIQNAVNAKLFPKKRLTDQVATNTSKIAALQKLQSLGDALKTSLDKLKSDATKSNAFYQRQATIVSDNSAVSPHNVLSASASPSALTGTHQVVVNNLAKNFVAEGTDQTSITTALGLTGTFDIGLAGKTAATINVTSTSTVEDIRNAINATSATSGVRADILQVSPGNYRLVIRGADPAKVVSVSNITGDNALNTLGVVNGLGAFSHITQPAEQANITLNGSTVTSDTNTFTNVLSGVTLNLLTAAPASTITLTIGDNVSGVKSAVEEVVKNYNALRTAIADNKKVGADGVVDANAFLYDESINANFGSSIAGLIPQGYGSAASYNGLRSIGVSLDANGDLKVDSSALENALKTNFADVQAVFATNSGSTVGFADTASTLVNAFSNSSTGSIASLITSLQSANDTLNKRADNIQTQVDAFQQSLILKYAKMEAALKAATTLKAQVLAILDGQTKR